MKMVPESRLYQDFAEDSDSNVVSVFSLSNRTQNRTQLRILDSGSLDIIVGTGF